MQTDPKAAAARGDAATGDGRIRPSADVVAQRLGDEVVLVHLRTNQIFTLNRTGARFWELVEAGSDLPSVRNALLAEFEVDEAALAGDLEGFVAALSEEELIDVDERS